jgi:hypothetical protein
VLDGSCERREAALGGDIAREAITNIADLDRASGSPGQYAMAPDAPDGGVIERTIS